MSDKALTEEAVATMNDEELADTVERMIRSTPRGGARMAQVIFRLAAGNDPQFACLREMISDGVLADFSLDGMKAWFGAKRCA